MQDKLYTKEEVIKIAWECRTFFHDKRDFPFGKIRESFRNFVNKLL